LIVGHTERRHRQAARLEAPVFFVLARVEPLGEHPRHAELRAEPLELREAAGREPELRLRRVTAGAVHRAERPGHEIAPEVAMEVRDHDRVDPRPSLLLAQAREHAGSAVEQQSPAAFDEIPRLRAAGIGPGRRTTDDCELHRCPVWHSPRVAEGAVELLQRVPLFSDLDRKELERVAASMKERMFSAGETVTAEGSTGVGFFVIESGNAKVTIGGEERRRLGPGDYFGEVALLNESARTATITAETDLRCYGLTSWEFRPLVETHGSMAWKLLQAMSKTYQSR